MYGVTYLDMAITPAPVAWQMLRELRHRPPGRAGQGQRRATFDAALEQSEQLFAAAGAVGVQARPLLLFYGLSQAGRAIAAASTAASADEWKLVGHGIRASGLGDAGTTGLAAVIVKDHGPGSFTSLAAMLGAESLPAATRLGALWPLLPDLGRRFRLPGEDSLEPLSVTPERAGLVGSADQERVRVGLLPASLAAPATGPEAGSDTGRRDWPAERLAVRQFLDQYPGLADARFISSTGNPVGLTADSAGRYTAPLEMPVPGDGAGGGTVEIRNVEWAYPGLHGTGRAQHPILVWWALSYALSMLARYEPRVWAGMVAISGCADAVAIEHLLSQALVSLPELIHRTVMLAVR